MFVVVVGGGGAGVGGSGGGGGGNCVGGGGDGDSGGGGCVGGFKVKFPLSKEVFKDSYTCVYFKLTNMILLKFSCSIRNYPKIINLCPVLSV